MTFDDLSEVTLLVGDSIVDLGSIVLKVGDTEVPLWPTTIIYSPMFVNSNGKVVIRCYPRTNASSVSPFSMTGNFSYSNSFYTTKKLSSTSITKSGTISATTGNVVFDIGYSVDGITKYSLSSATFKDKNGTVILKDQTLGPVILGEEVAMPTYKSKHDYTGSNITVVPNNDKYTVGGNQTEKELGEYEVTCTLNKDWYYWGAGNGHGAGSTGVWKKTWYIAKYFWDDIFTKFPKYTVDGIPYFKVQIGLDGAQKYTFTGTMTVYAYNSDPGDEPALSSAAATYSLHNGTFKTNDNGDKTFTYTDHQMTAGHYYAFVPVVQANSDNGIPPYNSKNRVKVKVRCDDSMGAIAVTAPYCNDLGPFNYDGYNIEPYFYNTSNWAIDSSASTTYASDPGTYYIRYVTNANHKYCSGTDYLRSITFSYTINKGKMRGYTQLITGHRFYCDLYGPAFLNGTSITDRITLYVTNSSQTTQTLVEDSGKLTYAMDTATDEAYVAKKFSTELTAGKYYQVYITIPGTTQLEKYYTWTTPIQETGVSVSKPAVTSTNVEWTGNPTGPTIVYSGGGDYRDFTGDKTATNPGTYNITWTLNKNYAYWANTFYDRSTYSVDWTLGTGINRPSYKATNPWTGSTVTAVSSGTGYSRTSSTKYKYSATEAGVYEFQCKLNEGYFWVKEGSYGESRSSMERTWTIGTSYSVKPKTSVPYTGQPVTPLEPNTTYYNRSGTYKATAKGNYTITVTLKSGYYWSDTGKSGSQDFSWSIV